MKTSDPESVRERPYPLMLICKDWLTALYSPSPTDAPPPLFNPEAKFAAASALVEVNLMEVVTSCARRIPLTYEGPQALKKPM